MAISVESSAQENAIRAKVEQRLNLQVRELAEEAGQIMAETANQLIGQRFDSRPANRRRYPGSRRAAGAVSYVIEGQNYPFNVRYKIEGGEKVEKRIAVLNFGRGSSFIRSSVIGGEQWPLKQNAMSRFLAFPQPEGAKVNRFVPLIIVSPATNKGLGFLEEARERAISKVFRRGGRGIAVRRS
jgi:hypothetical protein